MRKDRNYPRAKRGVVDKRRKRDGWINWRNEKSTAETIVDGWLHTGDLGYLHPDGWLYVLGRFKSLLIANDGEKYSPEGIEETIAEQSKIYRLLYII